MMRALIAAIVFAAAPGVAAAQSCIGIETRVITQTLGLDAAVAGQIGTSKAAMLGIEELNRARLLSAVKVMTQQQSASGDQAVLGEQRAAEASASAYVAQREAYAVLDAKTRYGSTGFGACGAATKAGAFASAARAASADRNAILQRSQWRPNTYGSPAAWIAEASQGGVYDAGSLFNGGIDDARKYVSFVMGPPDAPPAPGVTAAGQGQRLEKANRDALKSTAGFVMASVASDFKTGGPIEKLREMSGHWLGQDGGEAWSVKMAGEPERGVLLDAVRVEAANVAAQAFSLKSNQREEAALAALLLARVNNLLAAGGDAAAAAAPGGR